MTFPIKLGLALLLSAGLSSHAQKSAAPPPLGVLADAGGYRVHLYCTGQGSPTVIVVGGGFSFDWGLIQPQVAATTRICTYDPSGTAWSDPFQSKETSPAPDCADRVAELHHVLQNTHITGPYVLVGFSIGGLVARLFTYEHPDDVAGMVIVDHALIDVEADTPARPPSNSSLDSPPVLISSAPMAFGMEDDSNFRRLPRRNRDLHTWAMSLHPLRPTAEMARMCIDDLERKTKNVAYPLGNKPLIVISTDNELKSYQRLQTKLLQLSRNSRQILAENSSHMVIIDEPEKVVNSIEAVVAVVRKRGT